MARKLTKKQKGFVKDYIKTGNGTQAALNNYDVSTEHTAAVIASENLTKPEIVKSIQEALPDDLLSKVHLEGLEASRIISANITYGEANERTNDFIEVADHPTRAKFLDLAYKIKGSYAPEKHLNTNLSVEISEAIAKKYAPDGSTEKNS